MFHHNSITEILRFSCLGFIPHHSLFCFSAIFFQCCDSTIQSIDYVMSIEKEQFEPYLSGYLGNSLEEAEQLQNKLQNFEPMAQVDDTVSPCLLPLGLSSWTSHNALWDIKTLFSLWNRLTGLKFSRKAISYFCHVQPFSTDNLECSSSSKIMAVIELFINRYDKIHSTKIHI